MARHNRLHIHLQDAVACPQPVAGWPGPDNGMTADKQDIAGKYDAIARYIDHCIAACMRRAYLDELHSFVSNCQAVFALESGLWRCNNNIVELERAEDTAHVLAGRPKLCPLLNDHSKQLWFDALNHLFRGARRRDDLSIGHQLIAKTVIAIGVRIHHYA